jgi:hypothetical protein
LIKLKRIILTAIASLTIATTGHATDYIPDAGSDEDATAAFNWLQDQFSKPHASVHYDAATNTYNWIGPKFHKRMSIKRDAFDEQAWYPYWKKQRPTVEAPRAKLVATPTTIAGLTIATTGHAADYIPDAGSDEEATTAFNDLQDQFGKPNAKIVHYDSATDTYNWIGPKLHKRMSLKREEFNDQVWYPYLSPINSKPASGYRIKTSHFYG